MAALIERLRSVLRRIRDLQGEPTYLARGVAIGVFVGIAPVLPLKTLMILALTFMFSSSTIAAILTCTIICNPLTYVPLYYLAWRVGNVLLPMHANWEQLEEIISRMQQSGLVEAVMIAGRMGLDTMIVILAGGLVVALPLACLSYPFAYQMFKRISQKRKK